MSNPNPQGSQQRFHGPRDTGSNTGSPEKPGSGGSGQPDMVRFGKKINFGTTKLSNEQLLQDHLREMRQHLIEKRNQRSTQIDEDRKYLARVADRDGQEQHLKMRSSEVLKNEFLFFNDQKQLENKLKREQEREEYQKSKLDYFPFVSGELLEQHRQGLSGQMRADLQNYLIAKSQGLVGSGDSRKHATPNRSSAASSVFKAMSDGSLDGRSDRLTKASTSIVKALHDSCYQVPEKNPRVIQDTDPVKNEAWRAALARHESEVAQQKSFNEVVMKKHYEKVAGDDAQVAHENDDRKQKQKRFFEEIRTQIDSNVSG